MSNKIQISAVVCTRSRGEKVVQTIEGLLGNTHPNFEVLLIDQSTNDFTEKSIEPFLEDPRFRYIKTSTVGKGISCNIGLYSARGDYIAYTDDDCIVPKDWLQSIVIPFLNEPRIAVVFCRVVPGPHDPAEGYIPGFHIEKDKAVQSMWGFFKKGIGLGAGMAVRREALLSIGGFDDNLGPGSKLRSGEDHDIAIRALLNHYWVYEAATPYVIHLGFRSWEEGKMHTQRDFFSVGAAYWKPIRCGYWQTFALFFSWSMLRSCLEPLFDIFILKRPRGFKRWYFIGLGIYLGLKERIDPNFILYVPQMHPLPTSQRSTDAVQVEANIWY